MNKPRSIIQKTTAPLLKRSPGRAMRALGLLLLLIPACASATSSSRPTPSTRWPTDDWQRATPEELGIDSQALAEAYTALHEQESGVNALVVVRHGQIAAEGYFAPFQPDSRQHVFSCTKSVLSALIGIALSEGHIESIDEPVLSFFPDATFDNVDKRKQQMTLRHLLTMSTGLEWHEEAPYTNDSLGRMVRSGDWVQFILDQSMVAEPGAVFAYNSGVSHLLSAIIQQTTGEAAQTYAKENLFDPLGFPAVPWQTDRQGRAIGGWGLSLTAREMAKLGLLYLHEGAWEGEQIVPAAWVEQSTTQHIQGEDEEHGYGFQWWIIPELSPRAFAALGLKGQRILVVPELDLVVVFASEDAQLDLIELTENVILPGVQSEGALPSNPEGVETLDAILETISQTP